MSTTSTPLFSEIFDEILPPEAADHYELVDDPAVLADIGLKFQMCNDGNNNVVLAKLCPVLQPYGMWRRVLAAYKREEDEQDDNTAARQKKWRTVYSCMLCRHGEALLDELRLIMSHPVNEVERKRDMDSVLSSMEDKVYHRMIGRNRDPLMGIVVVGKTCPGRSSFLADVVLLLDVNASPKVAMEDLDPFILHETLSIKDEEGNSKYELQFDLLLQHLLWQEPKYLDLAFAWRRAGRQYNANFLYQADYPTPQEDPFHVACTSFPLLHQAVKDMILVAKKEKKNFKRNEAVCAHLLGYYMEHQRLQSLCLAFCIATLNHRLDAASLLKLVPGEVISDIGRKILI